MKKTISRPIKVILITIGIVAVIFVMLLIFPIGIGMHIDSTTDFHVYGTISDSNNRPISGAEVFFVDRGFDYVRSKNTEAGTKKVGVSANNGSLDTSYSYFWGRNEPFTIFFFHQHLNLWPQNPSEKFELIFRKPGYVEKAISYDAKSLTNGNNVVELNLGQIQLDTVGKSQ